MKKGWAGTFAVLVLGATVLTGCGSTSDSGHIKLKIATEAPVNDSGSGISGKAGGTGR